MPSAAGQEVAAEREAAEQDGWSYRARRAWPWGATPAQRPGTTVVGDRSGAYTSSLSLTFDEPGNDSEAPAGPEWQAFSPEDPDCSPALRRLAAGAEPGPALGEVRVTVYELARGGSEVRVETAGTPDVELIDAAIAELRQARRLLAR